MDITFNSPGNFYVMAKPVGSTCNLGCSYCYYLDKENLYPQDNNEHVMNEHILEQFIAQYIYSTRSKEVLFTWHGGEPVMRGHGFFEKVIHLQKKYSEGKIISNSLQTNGTLLTDDWCRYFSDHGFLIGISIDGPEHCHDHYRKFTSGRPSFAKVMKGLELLIKYNIEFNTLTTINDYNSHFPEEVYTFLKKAGSHYMQFTPIVEKAGTSLNPGIRQSTGEQSTESILDFSVDPEIYGSFLIRVFDEWIKKDVGNYFVITFDCVLAGWMGVPPPLCLFAETCGNAAVIEYNGDIYSCDHFVFPEYRIDNIMNRSILGIMSSDIQRGFGLAKRESLPRYCRDCEFLRICNGECPKNRIISTPDGEPGLNYLCKGLKKFYQHTAPYMKFMANEIRNGRPAANVKFMPRPSGPSF